MLKRFFLLTGIGISLFLIWFAVSNYRASRSIAEENLLGLAHSLAAAIENMAVREPSLRSLAEYHSTDIAFFALVDSTGKYRFHTNADLVGTSGEDGKFLEVLGSKASLEARTTLGTGEKAFEFYTPLYLPGETLALRITLHTYRADAVVRRAEFTMVAMFSLLVGGWTLAAILYRFSVREERHKLAMEQRERLAQLGEMGAMLAHEIRNPLAGIKGFAQVIERKPREARNAGFAQGIVREVLRLENLVNDLLAYAGSDSSPMVAIYLHDLVAWAVSFARQEAEEQHVTITSDCHEGLLVFGNRDRLGQVLLNLVKNALQAMPGGGSLGISAKVAGKTVMIAVTDTGQGIAPDRISRIFEPFFTTRARGTGLGLALCKKIIEEHKGTIRVESEPEKGTTVFIVFPGAGQRNSGGSHP